MQHLLTDQDWDRSMETPTCPNPWIRRMGHKTAEDRWRCQPMAHPQSIFFNLSAHDNGKRAAKAKSTSMYGFFPLTP